MSDLLIVAGVAFGCSGVVGLLGLLVLRSLHGRSVTAHVSVLLATTVAAVAAGVLGAAKAMFLSEHDLRVLLPVVAVAGLVSLGVALWYARRVTAESMWAAEAAERERQLEASRRDVVAWVSHDLRTPLAGMRAMAEALEDGVVADPATAALYHRRLRIEADRMAGLVDDLFELSRIHAGALQLSLAAVPLGDVVSDAVATAGSLARARGIRVLAQAGEYGVVQASEPELGRVLANLLVNAVRHTPADGVVWVQGGAEAGWSWFAVTDQCGGIPEHDLPRVFDVAFRGETARTPTERAGGNSDSAGGGLGLAIARGLVEAHRGQITVTNVGSGCRFTVRLPSMAG
jgi:signal transduction histidine kinase